MFEDDNDMLKNNTGTKYFLAPGIFEIQLKYI